MKLCAELQGDWVYRAYRTGVTNMLKTLKTPTLTAYGGLKNISLTFKLKFKVDPSLLVVHAKWLCYIIKCRPCRERRSFRKVKKWPDYAIPSMQGLVKKRKKNPSEFIRETEWIPNEPLDSSSFMRINVMERCNLMQFNRVHGKCNSTSKCVNAIVLYIVLFFNLAWALVDNNLLW